MGLGLFGASSAIASASTTRAAAVGSAPQGTGSTFSTDSSGKGTLGLAIILPNNASRYRIRLRNYNTVTGAAGTALTGTGIAIGNMAFKASANQWEGTGDYSGTSAVVQLVSSSFSIPGDGSFYTSPWIATSTHTLRAATEYVLRVAYDTGTGAAVTGIPRGVGTAWHLGGDPATTNGLTVTGSVFATLSETPLDWQVEYETTDPGVKVLLCVGDSITAGQGGGDGFSFSYTGQPVNRSWPNMWATTTGNATINLGVSGSITSEWSTASTARWTRYDTSRLTFDAAYIGLGSNNANLTTPTDLTTFQSNYNSIISNARAIVGLGKPLILGGISPRGLDTTTAAGTFASKEAARTAYNLYLGRLPQHAAMFVNWDRVLRDPALPTQLDAEYRDGALATAVHMSRRGTAAMAAHFPMS